MLKRHPTESLLQKGEDVFTTGKSSADHLEQVLSLYNTNSNNTNWLMCPCYNSVGSPYTTAAKSFNLSLITSKQSGKSKLRDFLQNSWPELVINVTKCHKRQQWDLLCRRASPVAQLVKNAPAMQETQETKFQFPGGEFPLEEEMATRFSILAWRIPWTEEPGWLQSKGIQRVGYDWAETKKHDN